MHINLLANVAFLKFCTRQLWVRLVDRAALFSNVRDAATVGD